MSVIGVFSGIYVVLSQGEKLYQQSHYTGRTGMVSVGKSIVSVDVNDIQLVRPVEYIPTPDTLSCDYSSDYSIL